MNIFRFNVEKDGRKALVSAMGEILECKPQYKGVPSFTYVVGDFTISMIGTVTAGDGTDENVIKNLLEQLQSKGYRYETSDEDNIPANPMPASGCTALTVIKSAEVQTPETNIESKVSDTALMSIDMPLSGISSVGLSNLEKLIKSKSWIIKRMTGADNLSLERVDDLIRFPWFRQDSTADEVDAYAGLVVRLYETAKTKKRVIAEERPMSSGESEKYKARCMLLSLGFIGSEYKQIRKILLAPFSGSGSFLTR
jgi:hypothetical protein